MSPARKMRSAKRHRHNRRWIITAATLLFILIVLTVSFIAYPHNSKGNKDSTSAINNPAFAAFTQHYLSLMKSLNSTQTKTAMAAYLDPSFNQTDLFIWETSRLTFNQSQTGWHEDPVQILADSKGICVQWSVVYVSACLALGYQSRIIVAADTTNWNFIHTWAEDYYNGTWVHVDPSDKVWNSPSHYQSWDWGKYIGSDVKIYAFEDGTFHDVTSTYS